MIDDDDLIIDELNSELEFCWEIFRGMNIAPEPYGPFQTRWVGGSFKLTPEEDTYLKQILGLKE